VFRAGEKLLRQSGYRWELVGLLCRLGQAELRTGDRDAARAALTTAEAQAAGMNAASDSEVGRSIAALRRALGSPRAADGAFESVGPGT
jgi:hypothetical protein